MYKLKRILVPAFIFQGIVIGGGYATGRELVHFFVSYGVFGSLLGMALAMAVWCVVLVIAFEYAVLTKAYDYDTLLDGLLGRAKILAEIVFVLLILLVVAVISDAADTIAQQRFGAPRYFGVIAFGAALCLGLMLSEAYLRRLMVTWSILLYAAYIVLLILVFMSYQDAIAASFEEGTTEPGWGLGAIQYASYNLAALPSVLFALRNLNGMTEARLSGFLAGILGMIPAVLFAVAMFAFLPEVLSAPVPLAYILSELRLSTLGYFFDIVIIGTLLQTGLGGLNALKIRIQNTASQHGRSLPSWSLGLAGLVFVAVSLGIGVQFGIVMIIAKGYGYLTGAFLALLVLPILTVGLWKCMQARRVSPG